MSDIEKEPLNVAADTPEGQGGGGGTKVAVAEDSGDIQKPVPVDPPDGGGGTEP
ncbi:MAG TPA: hypothetical protein VK893_05125 [Pyrinomonadaceae bacterium]|nr:hypothetical protein [Pyrinomonadaceae bacterium]